MSGATMLSTAPQGGMWQLSAAITPFVTAWMLSLPLLVSASPGNLPSPPLSLRPIGPPPGPLRLGQIIYVLVSSLLHDCIQSITVATELKGSDHYSITTSFALPGLSATVSEDSQLGVPLRQVYWKGGCRLDYVHHLELAAPALDRCADLVLTGHVEQAMDTLSQVLVCVAHAADMRLHTVRLDSKARPRPHQPFYDQECVRLKREWRRAGRVHGFSAPLVRGLERHYHSYVRSRKRVWLMSQLDECVALFHTCPRHFWRTFRGHPPSLPLPLHDHEVWSTFMSGFTRGDIETPDEPLMPLSDVAYPPTLVPDTSLNRPSTLSETEDAQCLAHREECWISGFPL